MSRDTYQEPLVGRYTSKDMKRIFSDDFKFPTWRKCWVALAEAQHDLGLEAVTSDMVAEMKKAAEEPIDYDFAKEEETRRKHDVMAHVTEYKRHCPTAEGVIHTGATSMYVCDNTELIQMREATQLVKKGLVNVISNMAEMADTYKDLATLGFTHYQVAQPTTIGKRFTCYIQDLVMDLEAVNSLQFKARGTKGTTGTQASYSELFDGNYSKVKQLDQLVAQKLGFDSAWSVTGQTYSRKFDAKVAEAMAGIAVSLSKFATDIRLLSNQEIVDEPFGVNQTGSSAMPYKRNPMRSERLCSLARRSMGLVPNFYGTASNQWLERTLDDSAIRRSDVPLTFMLTDAILRIANNLTDQSVDPKVGNPMTFYEKQINRQLGERLPFIAAEAILMDLVQKNHSRQTMHEIFEKHAHDAGRAMKEEASDNDLFDRLADDSAFPMNRDDLEQYLANPNRFTGFASEQTTEYLEDVVKPILAENADLLGKADSTLNV